MDAELKKEIVELIKEMQNQDSIEIGNSKTGVIKIYCNFEKATDAQDKLTKAIALLKQNRAEVFDIE
jgi:hypothetical protein